MPVGKSAGTWLWDLHAETADAITQAGASRQVLYCPGLTASVKDLDVWWWYSTGDKTSTHRVTAYAWMIKRTDGNMDSGLQPTGKQFHDKLTGTNVSAVELVADATLSEGPNEFLNVSSTSGIIPVHRSAHMEKSRPGGGNILYKTVMSPGVHSSRWFTVTTSVRVIFDIGFKFKTTTTPRLIGCYEGFDTSFKEAFLARAARLSYLDKALNCAPVRSFVQLSGYF